MKAIIPVAGAGTNLRPLTYTQPKALIPMAGKTILSVILDQLRDAGVSDFVFIIGYLGEKIQAYIERTYPDMTCSFVQQTNRRGTGHAIWLTEPQVKDEEILIVFGDTICDYNVSDFLKSNTSQIGVRKVDDPRSFGVAEVDEHNSVTRVVEKPLIPKSNMAMVGIYYIRESARLYEVLGAQLSTGEFDKDEYHLTGALQEMIVTGTPFGAWRMANWYDCGRKESLLATNAILLKQAADEALLASPTDSEMHDGSVIIHPVSIAAGCKIRHSIVGPNVTVGERTTIVSSIIKDSIIGSYAELNEVLLHNSIIGSDASVRGLSQSLNIGDNTEIDFG